MAKQVTPEVYFIGATSLIPAELMRYLRDSGNEDFLDSMAAAKASGLNEGEILCSFYAKLCYASLTMGKNQNVTRIRDVPDNLRACFDQGHGSVFEHVQLNFVVRNCSRVLTHELVRHRVGTAFSQTSGRYVRTDELDMIVDPILFEHGIMSREEASEAQAYLERLMITLSNRIAVSAGDFATKKKLTSAARRWAPNGQANEIGLSLNLRALRHIVQLRTGRHAEWEIRLVFARVYELIKDKYPLLFHGATEETVDGIVEVSGMKTQPY
jgi:thymidylate synthase (FAD)